MTNYLKMNPDIICFLGTGCPKLPKDHKGSAGS